MVGHLLQRLAEQAGSHTLTCREIAPRHLVDAVGGLAAPVTAPEQQHVLPSIPGQYHRRTVGLLALQDVHDVGGREVGILIVDHSTLAQVGTIGIGTHGTAVGVLRGIGNIVGADEDDVVVVVAVSLQHLVDAQHVGLVAVVLPPVAALHQHGVLVGEGRIVDGRQALVVFVVESLFGILYQIVPRCQHLTRLGTAFGTVVGLVVNVPVIDNPVDVGGVQGGGVALAVELHRSRGTLEAKQLSLFEGREVDFHTRLAPGIT